MQPSTDRPDHDRSTLARLGPVIGIVVAIAIVVAIVVASGGGDDDDAGSGTSTTTGERPSGAVSFSEARENNLDVTFPDTCDDETGRIAMPFRYAPECYANSDEPTTASAPGVTADTITVVVYLAPENDPVIDFITMPIKNDDTNAQAEATYRGYTELFQAMYQTYGRKVELKFLTGSGIATDEVAARADAVKAVEELGAFAVWGGPVLSNAWTDEIHARGAVCLGCPGIDDNAPSVFTVTASAGQTNAHLVEYIDKKLAGKPAEHAGDPAMQTKERVFGHLYIESSEKSTRDAQGFEANLKAKGVTLAEQVAYELEPARLQEQATSIITRLKSAGVTSVVIQGDPIAPATFTREATKQQYRPEWIIGGSALMDSTAFGRTFDPEQWAHAFGISSLPARVDPEVADQNVLYEWFHGTTPPADDTAPVIYPQPGLFFAALQAAGPNLTVESFRDGLFSLDVQRGIVARPTITFGDRGYWPDDLLEDGVDYNGIDDFTEIWWDPDVTGPDEIKKSGSGMYRYVASGKRYLPGEWTSDLAVFDTANTITVLTELPEAEQPKDYPPPER